MGEIEKFVKNLLEEIDEPRKEEVTRQLEESANPCKDFFIMVVLSAVIATLGLVMNSPAVIIGAMLVAPLMTPIMAISLATVKGNLNLFRKAVEAEIKGIILAVMLATVLALFIPNAGATSEVLARISPTPLDLLVALASGAAAAYALARPNIGAALPGVAIATAIMPPLCTVGVGIALRRYDIALGAFLLFAANIIAINLAGSLIFWLLGFSPVWSEISRKDMISKIQTSALLLLLVLAPLAWIMYDSMSQTSMRNAVDEVLNAQISGIEQAKLSYFAVEHGKNGGPLHVSATIESPKQITADKAGEVRVALEKKLGTPVQLDLKVIGVEWLKVNASTQ